MTSAPTVCREFVLRNYPDDDALDNPEKYPKTLAFSPDIIPLYGAKADHDALVHPSAWRGFTGMPIVGGDVNHVYIRGHGSGGPYIASLRAFPSELIMWPQVWSKVAPVSSGPVVIPGGDTPGRYASTDPLWFRPPHGAGNAYSLVANVFKHDPANTHKDLHEYEPIPSFDLQNFDADDFLSYLYKNEGITFYNVIVADPTSEHISAHTRLRIFGKSSISVRFVLEWHSGSPAPDGLEASLVDNRGKIVIPRAPLSSFDAQKPITLEPLYDGVLTLNIFSPEENPIFEPYSGLSLKVFKVGKVGPAFSLAGIDLKLSLQPVNPPQLLGTLNIIFDPQSTRNIRFASPSAKQLRESQNCPVDDRCQCPRKRNCDAIPTTRPAATGWWFRSSTGDTNHFPRTSLYGHSPDIQFIGTDSDLTKPDLWSSLQNPNIDYSTKNAIELQGGVNNYIFLRGHSTLTDIDVQTRISAVVGGVILHPSQYATGKALQGRLVDGSGTTNQQSVSVEDSNQFYVFNRPFDIKAPPNPDPGHSGGGPSWGLRPHYCIIAEARQKRKCSPVYPKWPSERAEDFKTIQDFANWVASSPLVCSRNIAWEPYHHKSGLAETCITWTCGTQLTFTDSSFYSSFWTIIIECDSPIIPPGCKWTLKCDDNEIFPNGLCFQDLPISTQSPAHAGCHFTGAIPGSAPKVTLTITWCNAGYKVPLPSVKIKLAITEVNTLSPVTHLGQDPHPESADWPFYVGTKYPYIGVQANPSPLPTFEDAGRQESWPYESSPQFMVGQVAIAAKSV